MLLHQDKPPFKQWLAFDRYKALWGVIGDRPQPAPNASGKQEGFHALGLLTGFPQNVELAHIPLGIVEDIVNICLLAKPIDIFGYALFGRMSRLPAKRMHLRD